MERIMNELFETRRSTQRGKWLRDDVPKFGWHCVRMVDHDDDGWMYSEYCEMCESTRRRYIHVMRHPQYRDELACGCVCAGYMTDNLEEAVQREERFRIRRELRKKPDTGFRRKGWHYSKHHDWKCKQDIHELTPLRFARLIVKIQVSETPVGWVGRIYCHYNLATATEPSDDWRIAALDAAELVEQRITDPTWLPTETAKADAAKKLEEEREARQFRKKSGRLLFTDPPGSSIDAEGNLIIKGVTT
jgi:hypothetical protein